MSDKEQTSEPYKIRIGLLHSTTGAMQGSELPVRYATEIALKEINDPESKFVLTLKNGVSVKPELVIFRKDCKSDDEATAKMAQDLILDDRVDVLFGCWTSSGRRLVKPIIENFDLLLFYPVQYEGFEQSSHIVYLGATPKQQILPALDWAAERLSRERSKFNYYLVGSDYVYPKVAHSIIKDHLQQYPAKMVGETLIPLADRDRAQYRLVAEHLESSKCDILFNTINGGGNCLLFKELHEKGLLGDSSNLLMLSFSLGETELFEMEKQESGIATDSYLSDPFFFQAISGKHNKSMSRLSIRLGEEMLSGFGERYPISTSVQKAYLSVYLWKSAIERAALNACTVQEAIRTEKVRNSLSGLEISKSIDPDGGRIHLTNLHTYKRPRIGRIRGCSVEVVYTGELTPPEPFLDRRKNGHVERFLKNNESREARTRYDPKRSAWRSLRKTSEYAEKSSEIGSYFAGETSVVHHFSDMFKFAEELHLLTLEQAKEGAGKPFTDVLEAAQKYLVEMAFSDIDLNRVLRILTNELQKRGATVPSWDHLAVALAKIKGFLYRDAPAHIRSVEGNRRREKSRSTLYLVDLLDYVCHVRRGSVWFQNEKVKCLTQLTELAKATDGVLFCGDKEDAFTILDTIPSGSDTRHEVCFIDDQKRLRYVLRKEAPASPSPQYERIFVSEDGGDLAHAARFMRNLMLDKDHQRTWKMHLCQPKEFKVWDPKVEEGRHAVIWKESRGSKPHFFAHLIACRDFVTGIGGKALRGANSTKQA